MNVSSVVEKVTFFVLTVAIARYLTREHYGEYATAMGLATFFAMISNLSINISIIRAINKYREKKNYYYTISIVVKLLLSVISYGLLVAAVYFIDYSESTRRLTIILGLVRIASEFITTLYAFMEADEKFDTLALFISIFSTMLLAGTLVVIFLNGDYFQIVDIRLIITVIFLLIIYLLIQKNYANRFSWELCISFIKSVIPFAGSFVASNIVLNAAILLLPMIIDTTSAGVYQNAFIFIISIGFIVVNLIRVLMPYLYKFDYKTNRDKFKFAFDLYSKILAVVAFYILLGILLYADIIIPLVFGAKYQDSIGVLRILAFSIPFSFSIGGAIIVTVEKQRILALFDVAGALFAVITSYIFIRMQGAQGAAWSYVFTAMLIYILSQLYLSIKGYVKYLPTFITLVKIITITIIIYYLFHKYIININVILSGIAMTALYAALLIVFIVKKDDIRIIREMLGK